MAPWWQPAPTADTTDTADLQVAAEVAALDLVSHLQHPSRPGRFRPSFAFGLTGMCLLAWLQQNPLSIGCRAARIRDPLRGSEDRPTEPAHDGLEGLLDGDDAGMAMRAVTLVLGIDKVRARIGARPLLPLSSRSCDETHARTGRTGSVTRSQSSCAWSRS